MRILNWKPEPKDERDYKFSNTFKVSSPISIPSQYVISIPEVWDQGDIGRCVGMSTAMATLYQSRVQSREIVPSPDFIYYNTRESEGTQNQDAGCFIRDAFKSLNKQGVCKLDSWPMDNKKVLQKPSQEAYKEGLLTLATSYHRLNNLDINELKFCIASGRPFVFGFNVFSSFMYGNWIDTMPIPNKSKESFIGGHAVLASGYSDQKKAFYIKNSWSGSWKDKGHFWMPYSYITSRECDDFWTLESISNIQLSNEFKIDITKIFESKKELSKLSEEFIVKIGIQFGLDVNLDYSKKRNLSVLVNYLKLEQ